MRVNVHEYSEFNHDGHQPSLHQMWLWGVLFRRTSDHMKFLLHSTYTGQRLHSSPVSIQTQSLALRTLRLLREIFTQQTQAPANSNSRSLQWQPWLAVCQRKRLRFLWFSFTQRTQRTQRKRLRLNGNRAWESIGQKNVKKRTGVRRCWLRHAFLCQECGTYRAFPVLLRRHWSSCARCCRILRTRRSQYLHAAINNSTLTRR